MTKGSKPPETKETSTKDQGQGQDPKQSGQKRETGRTRHTPTELQPRINGPVVFEMRGADRLPSPTLSSMRQVDSASTTSMRFVKLHRANVDIRPFTGSVKKECENCFTNSVSTKQRKRRCESKFLCSSRAFRRCMTARRALLEKHFSPVSRWNDLRQHRFRLLPGNRSRCGPNLRPYRQAAGLLGQTTLSWPIRHLTCKASGWSRCACGHFSFHLAKWLPLSDPCGFRVQALNQTWENLLSKC